MTHVYVATFYSREQPRILGTYRSLDLAIRACVQEESRYWKGNGHHTTVREVELDVPYPASWGREVWQTGDPVPEIDT